MGRTVPSDDHGRDGESELERDRELLRREAASRNKRIKTRREQQLKKDAARRLAKRKRMFKVMGIWIAILVIGFLVVAWFSPKLINWMHGVMR